MTSLARRSSSVNAPAQDAGVGLVDAARRSVAVADEEAQLLQRGARAVAAWPACRRTAARSRSDAALRTITSGRRARWKISSGTRAGIATRAAEPMAKLFGACSPIVMCSAVMISSARIVLSAAATPWRSDASTRSAGSSSAAMVGSPSAPSASEAIVMPSWQAARYSSRCAAWRRASRGPRVRLLGQPLGSHGDQRELGRHEEPVDQHEQRRSRPGEQPSRRRAAPRKHGAYA